MDTLRLISDGSLDDVIFPDNLSSVHQFEIKEECNDDIDIEENDAYENNLDAKNISEFLSWNNNGETQEVERIFSENIDIKEENIDLDEDKQGTL